MLKKQRQNSPKLTKEEKRAINTAIVRARGESKNEQSAQDTIPYERMYPDGICRVTDKLYTKQSVFKISTISLPKMKIRQQSLKVGVIFSITLIALLNFNFPFLI